MGTTTLQTRRERLAAQIGLRSNRIQTYQETELNDHIGRALRVVYDRTRWPFLESEWRVELEATYSTGTVTGSGTAITGSGTSWDTGWSSNIRLRVDGEVYRVASIDSTTGITLTDSLLSDITDATSYHLYIDRYTVGTDVESIESVALANLSTVRLDYRTPAWFDQAKSTSLITAHPENWTTRGVDSSGDYVIELWPIPGFNEILHVRGFKDPTIPSADAGTDDVPDRWSHVVDDWARVFLYEWTSDQRYSLALQRAEASLSRMVDKCDLNVGPVQIQLDPSIFSYRGNYNPTVVSD